MKITRAKNIITGIVLLFAILNGERAAAQFVPDSVYLKQLFENPVEKVDHKHHVKQAGPELKVLVSVLFVAYKKVFSSQDVDACVFTPSCSVYTMEAIEKKGFFAGILNGFDRLLRCHAYHSPNEYPVDKQTRRYYDPF